MQINSASSANAAFGAGRVPGGATFRETKAKVESAVADKLGISVDQLQAQLKTGESLADVAKDNGLSRDALVSTITSALQSAGAGSATMSAVASTGSTQGPDLAQLANRIADQVGGHRHHHGSGSTSSSTSAAALAAAASTTRSAGQDADGDTDGSTSTGGTLELSM